MAVNIYVTVLWGMVSCNMLSV